MTLWQFKLRMGGIPLVARSAWPIIVAHRLPKRNVALPGDRRHRHDYSELSASRI
jgi:hypothetical protein